MGLGHRDAHLERIPPSVASGDLTLYLPYSQQYIKSLMARSEFGQFSSLLGLFTAHSQSMFRVPSPQLLGITVHMDHHQSLCHSSPT